MFHWIDSAWPSANTQQLVSTGCSIYTYDLDFGTQPNPETEVACDSEGVTFYVEKKRLAFLQGLKIDFLPEKGGFMFDNPNVKDTLPILDQ